mmetsp:Transcript_36038/g.93752  ORF Transcript_36038/g.93752 Transcript_36038/m.93752 type:complete len:262 (-) Transcript_36038:128-913(-)
MSALVLAGAPSGEEEANATMRVVSEVSEKVGSKAELLRTVALADGKTSYADDTFSMVRVRSGVAVDMVILAELQRVLNKGGMIVCEGESEDTSKNMLYSGFENITTENGVVTATKPNWEQAAAPLKSAEGSSGAVWSVAAVDDELDLDIDEEGEEEEMIDEEELLEEDEYDEGKYEAGEGEAKPRKKKTCANCTCGKKDEEDNLLKKAMAEATSSTVTIDTSKSKSSCGNCALGDAFRCSTCPYLGLPPFKEGEKVVVQLD